MANHKFVSAAKPADYADRLHEAQLEIAKLKAKLKDLELQEKQLSSYLIRFSRGTSFVYASNDGYQKVVKISEHKRMILDQEKVRKLLKARTPYKPSTWVTASVDWQYEMLK